MSRKRTVAAVCVLAMRKTHQGVEWVRMTPISVIVYTDVKSLGNRRQERRKGRNIELETQTAF